MKELFIVLGAAFGLMLTICLIILFVVWMNSVNIPLERMAMLFFGLSIFCFIIANIIAKKHEKTNKNIR